MRSKYFLRIWIHFIRTTFLISCITVFLMNTIFYLDAHFNDTVLDYTSGFWGPLFFILFNVAVSSVFTIIICTMANKFMKPVKSIIEATQKVATGDFSIRLDEKNVKYELRDMNKSFNKMVKELEGIETLRNDFIVNVSHEFKTPIAAIEGYATLLQDSDLSEEERIEYTQIILDSTSQLSSLSGNILKLSKLENQEIVPDKRFFSLDEQLRQALLMLESQWSKKNIDIDMDLQTIEYYGSEDLLMQVWLNIFGNAIKFTPYNGIIVTRLRTTPYVVKVIISDNGVGISDEVLNKIFDKFYQGDHSRNFQGNGLGLTLVKKILDLCKCDISVKSKVNEGTTFSIILPIENKQHKK